MTDVRLDRRASCDDYLRRALAATLLGRAVCFAHQPDGPVNRVVIARANGMIVLDGMPGEFAPRLFVPFAPRHSPLATGGQP
jgi:hypothetical protein